jgi:hypothetical protein
MAALDQASKENYLGNPEVISKLLVRFVTESAQRRDSSTQAGEVERQERADAMALADIFLGRVPKFAPMIPWNSPGNIDEWIAAELKHSDVGGETPEELLASAMIHYLHGSFRIWDLASDGMAPEEWQARFTRHIQRFIHLLLGIPTPNDDEED